MTRITAMPHASAAADRPADLASAPRAPRLPRVRRHVALGAALRLHGVLRPARGRLRLRRRSTRERDRGRPAEHLALRAAAARSRRRRATSPNLEPGFTPLVRADNLAARARHRRRCGSRTTAATRPTRSRTASSPSRWRPPASSASPRVACAVHRQPGQRRRRRRRPRRAATPCVFIPPTSSTARSSRPRSTAARCVAVDGNYDDVNRLCSELAGERRGLGVRQRQRAAVLRRGLQDARLRDRRAARLAAARPGRRPDGVRLAAHQGRQGLPASSIKLGLVEDTPYTVFGAQATGCSPVSAAFDGRPRRRPARCKPDTIAKSLAIGNPADGPYVLDVVRRTGGAVEDVTDDEIVDGIRLLARDRGHLRRDRGRRDRRRRCAS